MPLCLWANGLDSLTSQNGQGLTMRASNVNAHTGAASDQAFDGRANDANALTVYNRNDGVDLADASPLGRPCSQYAYEYRRKDADKYQIDTTSTFRAKDSYKRNISYMGLAFVADGFIVKAQKRDFRYMRTYFKPNFKTTLDNYSQYSPLVATFALKALGVKSASSWKRMTVNSAMSYVAMAAIVNAVKYTTTEMRPDNSQANSFPSGHTATVFAGATILHKEFGYLSPWYSIGGYLAATATGVSRIMNNRHWISDVLVGAGVGIVSTDLGYFLGDLLLKGKGVEHQRKYGKPDITYRPSFVSLSIGTGAGPSHINTPDIFDNYDDNGVPTGNPLKLKLKTGRAVAFNIEGAYYLNDYIGIGGRVRAMTIPFAVESFNQKTTKNDNGFRFYVPNAEAEKIYETSNQELYILQGLESHQLGMIDLSAGVYASYPITPRLRLGTKLLVGNKITTGFAVDAIFSINPRVDTDGFIKSVFDAMLDEYGQEDDQIFRDEVNSDLYHSNDFIKIRSNNTLTLGTGLNLTYAYKDNVALKLFVDYDYAHPNYTYELNNRYDQNSETITDTFSRHTAMNIFTGGVGMEIFF